jgi:hypothetical protein
MFSGLKKTRLSQGNVKQAHFGIFRFAKGQIETDGSQLVVTHSEAHGSIADACRSPPTLLHKTCTIALLDLLMAEDSQEHERS